MSGFPLKNAPPEQLTDALRVVAGGDASLAPFVTRTNITKPITACRFGLAATLPPEGGLVSSTFVGDSRHGQKGAVNGLSTRMTPTLADEHPRVPTCGERNGLVTGRTLSGADQR